MWIIIARFNECIQHVSRELAEAIENIPAAVTHGPSEVSAPGPSGIQAPAAGCSQGVACSPGLLTFAAPRACPTSTPASEISDPVPGPSRVFASSTGHSQAAACLTGPYGAPVKLPGVPENVDFRKEFQIPDSRFPDDSEEDDLQEVTVIPFSIPKPKTPLVS